MEKIPTETVVSLSPRIFQCLQGASRELVLEAERVVHEREREREGFASAVHLRDLNPEELHAEDATLFFCTVENVAKTARLNGAFRTQANQSKPCTSVVWAATGRSRLRRE